VGRLPRRTRRAETRRPPAGRAEEALDDAGFEPRFRRTGTKTVEITLRDCPFRDLLDEHRDLVCSIHEGLLEGMLGASRPAMRMTRFEPLRDRTAVCRLTAQGA
jgi:predicted ArsR family transcriptional regulator